MVEKITVTASRDTRGKDKSKEEFGVVKNLVEGKIVDKNDINTTFVTAEVSGFARFLTPIGRLNGNLRRRHLTATLDTTEGVGGQRGDEMK